MDVLVVVGGAEVPERIAARARRTLPAEADADLAPLVADLRAHLPRVVGVAGAAADAVPLAAELHRAGLAVELLADGVPGGDPRLAGIEVRPLTDTGAPMQAADSLLDLIGHTPLLRLDRTARDLDCHLLAKLETFNPGGSSKDRPALAMVLAAERDGRLQPGGTIVEPTSGNTGVGLAIVAARRGYRCTFVCPDKVAGDKIALLRAYGAEVIVCPTAVDPGHPDSYYSVSDRLAREIPGGWKPDQYSNPENPRSQEQTTGPEIWEQTRGRITHFVAGVGTGGTISGVGAFLKRTTRPSRSLAAIPRAASTPEARAGPTWSRASARTSGPAPTTPPSSTGSSPSATPSASPPPGGSPGRRGCSWGAAAAPRWPPPSSSASASAPTP